MSFKDYRIIFETEDKRYRIIEVPDEFGDIEDLKGEMYDPKVITDIDPEKLREEEKAFENLVSQEGVFGYVLEKWNALPNKGYEQVDACWGFIGSYSPNDKSGQFDHEIVAELKRQILND